MVALPQMFDARAVAPANPDGQGAFSVGLVPAKIVKNDMVQNKTPNTGGHVALTFEGMAGENLGRTMVWRLNLYNIGENAQQAIDIAYKQLSAICHAVGVFNVTNMDELMNRPLIAVVRQQKDNPQYTEIAGVADYNGDVPGRPGVKVMTPVAIPVTAAAPAPAGQVWQPPAQAPAAAPVQQPAPTPAATAFGPATTPVAGAPAGWPGQPAATPAAPAVSAVANMPDWAKPKA